MRVPAYSGSGPGPVDGARADEVAPPDELRAVPHLDAAEHRTRITRRDGGEVLATIRETDEGQVVPNEHVLAPIMREGLQMMTGLFWDLADNPVGPRERE